MALTTHDHRPSRSIKLPDGHQPAENQPVPAAGPAIHEGFMRIDPATAKHLLENNNYGKQRRLERDHVKKFVALIEYGAFWQKSQLAFAQLPDGKVMLINGQHRLHALIEANAAATFQVAIDKCADIQEAAQLYYRQDHVQRVRTVYNIVDASGLAEELGLPRMVVVSAVAAGKIIANDFMPLTAHKTDADLRTPDGMIKAMRPWLAELKDYWGIIKDAAAEIRKRLTTPAVIAVALVTMREQPVKAIPFWGGLARQDGLRAGDPRQALAFALTGRSFKSDGTSMVATVGLAWNYWFNNSRVINLRVPNGSVVVIDGTSFTKGKRFRTRTAQLVTDGTDQPTIN